jgi:hypothetical protein
MLARQLDEWHQYPEELKIILVDDGSQKHPITEYPLNITACFPQVQIYRIKKDIPWNRGAARNLGTAMATTDWVMHVDIDHVLPAPCARELLDANLDFSTMYRFRRFRRGPADETRNKDAIPREKTYGEIKPHGDSYLVSRDRYWQAGGYNEAFAGCLGGGSPFLGFLERIGPAEVLRNSVFLECFTRGVVPDSSVTGLSRDTSEYSRRRKRFARAGTLKGKGEAFACENQKWERVL